MQLIQALSLITISDFFFQLLNLPLVHCGGWACVPKDFPHSVVKQLFPEACYPHTHTSLKIAARPSLYSLLSKAQCAQFCLSFACRSVFSCLQAICKAHHCKQWKNMYAYISNRCKSGKRPASSTLAFSKSVDPSSIEKMVLLVENL